MVLILILEIIQKRYIIKCLLIHVLILIFVYARSCMLNVFERIFSGPLSLAACGGI